MLRDDSALRVEEVKVGSTTHYLGKPLKKCKPLLDSGVVLVSMRRSAEKRFIFNPPLSTVLEKDATLVVIGTPEQLAGVRAKLLR